MEDCLGGLSKAAELIDTVAWNGKCHFELAAESNLRDWCGLQTFSVCNVQSPTSRRYNDGCFIYRYSSVRFGFLATV